MHGGSPRSVDQKFGEPFIDLVNVAGTVAWHFIMLSMPALDKPLQALWPENGQFANVVLVAGRTARLSSTARVSILPRTRFPISRSSC